jgi:CheY-like chemotaxis protein
MKMKILVIDDLESIRQVLSMALEEAGFEVLTATSGETGLEIFRQNGNLDLIITDNDMPPGMNGQQVIAEIERLKPSQPMILFTANEELLLRLENTPRNFLLMRKPSGVMEIYAKVAAAINN